MFNSTSTTLKSILTLGLTLLLAASSANSQHIVIASPASGTTVARGTNFTVEIDRPSFTSSVSEVAVVIQGFEGPMSYKGPYNPVNHPDQPITPPYQNFSVAVPVTQTPGPMTLFVTHFSLIGAAFLLPFVDTANITLIVV